MSSFQDKFEIEESLDYNVQAESAKEIDSKQQEQSYENPNENSVNFHHEKKMINSKIVKLPYRVVIFCWACLFS